MPDFEVDTERPHVRRRRPRSPGRREDGLLRTAFDHRPDLVAAGYQKASPQASIELARRQKLPDIALSVNYSQTGYGSTRWRRDLAADDRLRRVRAAAGLLSDAGRAPESRGRVRHERARPGQDDGAGRERRLVGLLRVRGRPRQLVQRMESGGLLKSAKTARDITRLQFEKGAAGLTDFLDAQRAYIATNVEYIQDVTNYWTAVFQLEQAVGMELH